MRPELGLSWDDILNEPLVQYDNLSLFEIRDILKRIRNALYSCADPPVRVCIYLADRDEGLIIEVEKVSGDEVRHFGAAYPLDGILSEQPSIVNKFIKEAKENL